MTRPTRFLETAAAPPQPSEEMIAAESDMVVILSALLCALICVAGLTAVVRCAWLRQFTTGHSPSPNKGLKKKAIQSLPRSTFTTVESTSGVDDDDKDSIECAICLADFVNGEEIRVLPLCGHSFHVTCIDTWLVSRSSCPSCRRILTPVRCNRCGYASTAEIEMKDQGHRHQHHQHSSTSAIPTFLP